MSELMYGLTSKTLFKRAGEIARARYPNGCSSADVLAGIVREVIAAARDSDEHRNGEDAQRLSGEAMPARAEGIAR